MSNNTEDVGAWLTTQSRGLKLTKTKVAELIGVSRPTLNKLEVAPNLLNHAQIEKLQNLGFIVPVQLNYESVICPTCGGHGNIFRKVEFYD